MVEKNPEAFRNISEVSTLLDIPTHVLRFWETRFNQLKPIKRNGGRRYYRPEDIILLKKIQDLLYQEGYTIKGAQQVLKGFAKPKQDAAVAELSSSAPSSAPMDTEKATKTVPFACWQHMIGLSNCQFSIRNNWVLWPHT
jgi:DNA-binding transcriptional MerR regulator